MKNNTIFNKYKKLVFIYLSFTIAPLLLYCTLMYIYDPLHIYRNPRHLFSENMYYQAYNFINRSKYDSIIIGTSMLENTSRKEASELLSKNFINISLSGSIYIKRTQLLSYIFKKHKIDTILFSLDMSGEEIFQMKSSQNDLYKVLYDDNEYNDFFVYFNSKHMKCLLTFSNDEQCIGVKVDYDRPTAWYNYYKNAWGGVKTWHQASIEHLNYFLQKKNNSQDDYSSNLKQIKDNINKIIFELIEKQSSTNFILIIPPYSTLFHSLLKVKTPRIYYKSNIIVQFFTEKCAQYSNCKLYAFGNDSFTNDLKNYKDMLHYSEKINTHMLKKIAKGENQLTLSNIDNYLLQFDKRVSSFDLNPIYEEVKNLN